jgi:poly(hydroxyalkanoate) depolymerase family esterase
MFDLFYRAMLGDFAGASASFQAACGAGGLSAKETRCDSTGGRSDTSPANGVEGGGFMTGVYAEGEHAGEYKLYVPPGHRRQPLPLVVMLHGSMQDPDDFAVGTRMNDAARERGFFVLYPLQAKRANAARSWNWFEGAHQSRGQGEPAMLAGMTREVIQRYGIDPERVYAAGMSAGGAMAAILGEAYPDLFAAVGVHSGLPIGAASDVRSAFKAMHDGSALGAPCRLRPTIVFHGDGDTTVHPANGDHVVAATAGRAALTIEHARINSRECTRRLYRRSRGHAMAEQWVVHGAGHAWSGGDARGSHTDAEGPDATKEMLRFFSDHRVSGTTRLARPSTR